NCGAGATTSEGPMLMSPPCRPPDVGRAGGGPTTPAAGTPATRRPEIPPASGAGATTEVWGRAGLRPDPWAISGGGATTESFTTGSAGREVLVADRGTAGGTRAGTPKFGVLEVAALISGGVVRLLELRRSRATRSFSPREGGGVRPGGRAMGRVGGRL